MPRFQIEMNGKRFEVEAPDQSTALNAVQGISVQKEQPINEGDWSGLQERLNTTEQRVKDSGPYRPQDIDATLKGEAKRQGLLYGQERSGQEGIGGIFGGSAANTLGLGLPRYLEAVTNPTVKTAYAHEFLKAADEGRAKAAPIASGAGTVAGYVGQAAMLPVSGAASIGGRALTAAGQAGTLGAVESGIESRGDISKIIGGGLSGALVGGAASAGIDKGIQAGRRFIDPLRGLAKSGPADEQATARILLAAKNAGIDDATAQRKLAELGPDGFIADVLGNYGSRLGRNAANYSPEAESLLASAAAERVGGQPQRMATALYEAASGQPIGKTMQGPLPRPSAGSPQALAEGIGERAQPATSAAYKAAEDAGYVLPDNVLGGLASSPKITAAIEQARREIMDRIAAYGPGEGSQLALYDAAKKILDKAGWKDNDEIAKALAKRLRDKIDENVPEYGGARALSQITKQRQEAVEFGAAAAKPRVTSEAAQNLGATQYPGDAGQAFALQKIEEILNRKAGQNALDIVNGTTANKGALLQALGNKAGDVQRQVAAERQFVKFKNDISGNSKTAQYLLDAGVFGGASAGSAMAGFDPSQAGTIGGLAALGRRGGTKLMEALAKKNEAAVAPEVARKLIERSLPKLVDAKGKPITETARRRLVEALMQVGGKGGAIAYGQN